MRKIDSRLSIVGGRMQCTAWYAVLVDVEEGSSSSGSWSTNGAHKNDMDMVGGRWFIAGGCRLKVAGRVVAQFSLRSVLAAICSPNV